MHDKMRSSITLTLGNNLENLVLLGSAAINGTGNSLDNLLTGNGANNTLKSLGGNDTLDGGGGADRMEGGVGDDTYIVDDAGDLVIEAGNNGSGNDTVKSSVSYTLTDFVDTLILVGSANLNSICNGKRRMNESEFNKEKLLGQSVVFQALDQQARQDLAAFAHVKRFAVGEMIFTMDAPGSSMMAIAEGTVRVEVVTPDGRDVILNELRAGDVFGEIALLDGGERSASVRSITNSTLVVLDRRALLDVLQRNPQFSIRLIELLCQRVRRSDERMMEIAFMDLPTRLARLLLRLSVAPPASPGSPQSRLSLSQSDLAKMIGNTRENVNRCLRKWQDGQLIDLRDGWIILRDRSALDALADGA
jgi:CRP/FNR family cyclic AMP-dependent transcriptional regulator